MTLSPTPGELDAAGENERLMERLHGACADARKARGAALEAVVSWLVAALAVRQPHVRRAAAEALAGVFGRSDIDPALRQLILRHRAAIEAPHVDRATLDSVERHEPGRGRYCAEYVVHTDYGVGGALPPAGSGSPAGGREE